MLGAFPESPSGSRSPYLPMKSPHRAYFKVFSIIASSIVHFFVILSLRKKKSSPLETGSCKCSAVILMEPCANGLKTTPQITKSSHRVARCDENVLFSHTKPVSILERSM